MVHICQFTLVRIQAPDIFAVEKTLECFEFPGERITYVLVAWVLVIVANFAPVVDKTILLHLNKFVPGFVEEPAPRDRGPVHHFNTHVRSVRLARIKTFDHWIERWMLFDLRKSIAELGPKQTNLGSGKVLQWLELYRCDNLDHWGITVIG